MNFPDIPYITEFIAGVVGVIVIIGTKLNKFKRDSNETVRDDSETNLVKAQNDAATKFVQDLIEEHRRVITQLTQAERERTNNAQRIGELTSEVNLLREQITEVKGLLQKLTRDLEESRRRNNEFEGTIIRYRAERDAAITEKEQMIARRNEECRQCLKNPLSL